MVSQTAIAIISALTGAGAGGVAGSAIHKGITQSGLKAKIIDNIVTNPNIPPEVAERLRNLPLPDLIAYAKAAIDRALADVVTSGGDPEAIAVLTAIKEFMQQYIQ